ncbi:hypothetical protein ABPG75_003448 [Micractinium tetrahymenae]
MSITEPHRRVLPPPPPACALATSEPDIRAALLEQKKAISNWDDFAQNQGWQSWDNTSSICSWSGIRCGPSGAVTQGFNLSLACDPTVTPPAGEACASPTAVGSLVYDLAKLADLSAAMMPFSSAGQGNGQPAGPGDGPGVSVDPGTPPGGSRGFPDPWWREGFPQLEVLSISRCSVGGLLPDTWGSRQLRTL